jgi:hypothetical protein
MPPDQKGRDNCDERKAYRPFQSLWHEPEPYATLVDIAEAAGKALPSDVLDYLKSGAGEERTLRAGSSPRGSPPRARPACAGSTSCCAPRC